MRNDKVLSRVKKKRNILCIIKLRKPNYIGHVLRRNCPINLLTKEISDGKTRNKTYAATRRPRRKERILETERASGK